MTGSSQMAQLNILVWIKSGRSAGGGLIIPKAAKESFPRSTRGLAEAGYLRCILSIILWCCCEIAEVLIGGLFLMSRTQADGYRY